MYTHQINEKKEKPTVIQQEKQRSNTWHIYIYICTKTNTGLQETCKTENLPATHFADNECTIK